MENQQPIASGETGAAARPVPPPELETLYAAMVEEQRIKREKKPAKKRKPKIVQAKAPSHNAHLVALHAHQRRAFIARRPLTPMRYQHDLHVCAYRRHGDAAGTAAWAAEMQLRHPAPAQQAHSTT